MMKKILAVATGLSALVLMNSCGTIGYAVTKGNSTVSLMRAPKDLEVSANGKKLEITSEVFAVTSSIGGTSTTSYYTSALLLPHKKKVTLELYSPSDGKRSTVMMKPRVSRNILLADILLTANIGTIIDIATGNLKQLTPRLVDVRSSLDGKKWLSHGKLKRMAKRNIKKGRD